MLGAERRLVEEGVEAAGAGCQDGPAQALPDRHRRGSGHGRGQLAGAHAQQPPRSAPPSRPRPVEAAGGNDRATERAAERARWRGGPEAEK